jgi:hypothetical protein
VGAGQTVTPASGAAAARSQTCGRAYCQEVDDVDTYEFARSGGRLLRWRPGLGPETEVLMASGWQRCPRWLRRQLCRRRKPMAAAEAESRRRRACAPASATTQTTSPSLRGRLRLSRAMWTLSPPLGGGASRFVDIAVVREGELAYEQLLGAAVTEALLEDAATGYEQARARLSSIEARAGTIVQAAGLTSTLVLGNSALIVGKDAARGAAGTVILIALICASLALATAGAYGLAATMRTFDRIAPHGNMRVVRRSKKPDPTKALRDQVASLLLSTRRTSLVANWKLQRLKRAVLAFLVAAAGILVASGALIVSHP